MGILTELAKRAALKTANRSKARDIPTQAEQAVGSLVPYAKSPLAQVAAQVPTPTPTPTPSQVTPAGLESPARRKFVKQASSLALNSALPGGGMAQHAIKAVAGDTPLAPILKNLVEPGGELVGETGELLPAMTPALVKQVKKLLMEGSVGDNLDDMGAVKTYSKAIKHILGNYYEPQHIPYLESAVAKLNRVNDTDVTTPFSRERYLELRDKALAHKASNQEWGELRILGNQLDTPSSTPRAEELAQRSRSEYLTPAEQDELVVLRKFNPEAPEFIIQRGEYLDFGDLIDRSEESLINILKDPSKIHADSALGEDYDPQVLKLFEQSIRSSQFTPEEIGAVQHLQSRMPGFLEMVDERKPNFRNAPQGSFEEFQDWLTNL